MLHLGHTETSTNSYCDDCGKAKNQKIMLKISINSVEFFNNSHFHKSFCSRLFAQRGNNRKMVKRIKFYGCIQRSIHIFNRKVIDNTYSFSKWFLIRGMLKKKTKQMQQIESTRVHMVKYETVAVRMSGCINFILSYFVL